MKPALDRRRTRSGCIASTILLTLYRISPKRGGLLAPVMGIVVHDHWKPYYTLSGVLHALCNAHHLRELEGAGRDQKNSARKMQRLSPRLSRNEPRTRSGRAVEAVADKHRSSEVDAIIAEGLAFHEAQPALVPAAAKARRRGRSPRRIGHNLLLRLSTRKQDVLRFLTDPRVPFTNNLAERMDV